MSPAQGESASRCLHYQSIVASLSLGSLQRFQGTIPPLRFTPRCQSLYGFLPAPRPTSSFLVDAYLERLLNPAPSHRRKSCVPLPRSTHQRQDCDGGVGTPPWPTTLSKVPHVLIRPGPEIQAWMTTNRLLPLSTRQPEIQPQGNSILMHRLPATDHTPSGPSAHVVPFVETC